MLRVSVILLIMSPLVLAAPARAEKLESLAWLSGHWAAIGEGHVEEIWTEPLAGTMTGMFRMVSDNQLRVLEYIVISREKDGIFYRFKHFNADYGTWEGKNPPLKFRLKESKKGRAVFENTNKADNQPTHISYLLNDDGRLTVQVGNAPDKTEHGETLKFVLTRQ